MKPDFHEIGRIVKRIKAHDSAAFAELYELTYQRLYLLSYSILENEEDAEDAVQESYIKIFANIQTLNNDKLFLAWANRIVYSICMRMCSAEKPAAMDNGHLQNIMDQREDSNPVNAALRAEKHKILADSIDKLPPVLRATLLFRHYEGLKIQQIADIMECPSGTVKSRLNTARKQLKMLIAKAGRGDIFFGAVTCLALKKSFTYYAKSSGMNPSAAYNVLLGAFSEHGICPDFRFHPRPPSASVGSGPSVPAGMAVGSAALGSLGVAALGSTIFSAPVVENIAIINPPEHYTNQNLEINAAISAPFYMLSDVYVRDDSGNMVFATLSGNERADFTVKHDGAYTVYAVSKSKKVGTKQITVDCIDKDAPALSSYEYTDTEVILAAEDARSGIDYGKVYGETEDAQRIEPVSWDKNTGRIVFAFPKKPFRLFLTDLAGNVSTFKVKIIKK